MITDLYRPPAGALLPFCHSVSEVPPPHVRHLYESSSPAEFRAKLDFLCRKFRPLQISELEQLSLWRHYKGPARTFILSFDDGARDLYDIVVPILRQKGIPAIFFINSATIDNRQLMWRHKVSLIIDRCKQQPRPVPPQISIRRGESLAAKLKALRFADEHIIDDIARFYEVDFDDYLRRAQPYLTIDQVLELSHAGFAIGAHSHDHPFLHEMSVEDQMKQISRSVEFIRALNLPCRYFAFPFHDSGVPTSVFSYLTDLDLVLAFGTSEARVDSVPFSFQRFKVDGPYAKLSMGDILRRIAVKSLVRRLCKTEIILRS